MTAPRRWIRLDVGWENSEWVADLPPVARLCWVLLLGYVKSVGVCGAAKILSPRLAAKKFDVPEADFSVMVAAAIRHGAVQTDGETWSITGWDHYQNEGAAERMRRYRADRSRLSPLRNVTERSGTFGHVRERSGQTLTLTETLTETETPKVKVKRKPPRQKIERATRVEVATGTNVVVSTNGNGAHEWNGGVVLAAWLKKFPATAEAMSDAERGKYGAACKRMAESHSLEQVRAAFVGMDRIAPYSMGEPWDPLDLERKFAKGLAAAESHPKIREQREEASLLEALKARQGGIT